MEGRDEPVFFTTGRNLNGSLPESNLVTVKMVLILKSVIETLVCDLSMKALNSTFMSYCTYDTLGSGRV